MAEILHRPIHVGQSHGVQIISPINQVGDPIWVAYDGTSHFDSVFHCGFDLADLSPNAVHKMSASSSDRRNWKMWLAVHCHFRRRLRMSV